MGCGLDPSLALVIRELGDPKVQELYPLAARCHSIGNQHHIGWFDVSVNDPLVVCDSHHICDLKRNL